MLSCLRLIRSSRVGPATFFRLISECGDAAAALAALPAIARDAGVDGYRPCSRAEAEAEYSAGLRAGARLICAGTPAYPAALAAIADAPPVLWALGDTGLLARPMVAVVGARNASSLGLRMARALAGGLAGAGFAVVSGLARGIDAAAHEAALAAHPAPEGTRATPAPGPGAGGTVAVLAGGIDVVYPPENAGLAARIAAAGLLLSEQPPGLAPQARHFPRRNRIVSGLSLGVVVVEAATRSGSLITARDALDQGREVMAVPGHPFDARAGGCNQLVRDGATLVRGSADVLAALAARLPAETVAAPAQPRGADERGEGRGAGARSTPKPPAAAPEAAVAHPAPGAQRGHGQGQAAAAGAAPRAAAPLAGPGGAPASPPGPGPRPAADAHTARICPGPAPAPAPAPPRARDRAERPQDASGIAALHRAILDRLGPSPLAEDQLIRDLARPAAEIAPELLLLELDGRIARQPGGLLCRLN